ncbi:MAG TPA: hypothetical protein DC054_09895 [Blastocatellia bacterium]|nr:hypothetical protein [Blastocatellia bacterium]
MRREIDQSELRQTLSAEAEAHLAECAACAAFRDERFRLRELIGALEPVVAPADFDVRLRARIARERDTHQQPFIFRLVMSTPAIVVAAVLVLVVGTIVFMNQRNRTQTPAIASTNENKGTVPVTIVPEFAVKTGVSPVNGTEDPSVNAPEAPRRINVAARSNTKSGPATNSIPEVSDSIVRAAQSFQLAPDRAGEVSLTAPVKPMVVTMYDERGGSRKIQLPPISFGSQRLTDNRTPVSMTNTRDW